MNTIKSRFERFAAFAFTSSASFEKGAELWDTISHYEFYLTEGEPNDTFVGKLEDLGCSRRWLLYATGEMFADNEKGRELRDKFMQGIGIANKKFALDNLFPLYVPVIESPLARAEESRRREKKAAAVKSKVTAKEKGAGKK